MGDEKKVSWRDVDYEELEKAVTNNDEDFLSRIDWEGWEEEERELSHSYLQAIEAAGELDTALASVEAISAIGLSATANSYPLTSAYEFNSAPSDFIGSLDASLGLAVEPLWQAADYYLSEKLQPLTDSLETIAGYIGESIDVTPFTRWANRIVNRQRHTTSRDFSENHAACQRFREWVETADATKGKRGEWTLSKLAELLHVSRKAASSYYQHPETMSEFAALSLHGILGDEEYFNLVHGPGAYDRKLAEEEKARAIERLRDEFEALLARVKDEDLTKVKLVAASIDSGIIAAERQLARNL